MTPREFPDISFRVFIGRILPDQLVISLSGIKRPHFFCRTPLMRYTVSRILKISLE